MVLDPPWDRILEMDSVMLTCQGPGDTAQWWHNSSVLAQQTATLMIRSATVQDSGEYSCQTGLSAPSDPQSLQVHRGECPGFTEVQGCRSTPSSQCTGRRIHPGPLERAQTPQWTLCFRSRS